MRSAKDWLRLGLALFAFLAWLSYLVFLVRETRSPIVLSRPQFLVSTLDVIAQVDSLEPGTVRVIRVHWPKDREELAGRTITVTNLAECKEDWTGPGEYILPLVKEGDSYRVAVVPRSPGLPSYAQRPRIYPATPEALRQLDEVPKAVGQK